VNSLKDRPTIQKYNCRKFITKLGNPCKIKLKRHSPSSVSRALALPVQPSAHKYFNRSIRIEFKID
jgi:hypothetical protein